MKAYPKYKPSNIEWIGEIPEHWEVKKLKFTDRVIMGQSPSSEDYNDFHGGLPFLQGNAEFGKINPNPKIWCETANKISSVGDILVSVRAPIGAVNMADQEYGIGRGLCAIRPIKSNNKYLYYFFISLNDELNSIGTGSTYTAISVDEVENIKIPYAELPEQCSISIYLEDRTQKIDSLIEKKRKLIDLLKEERTATINQTVTKGLNSDVPMKESGIEWLGEIPKQWEVTKLKYLTTKIGSGVTPKGGSETYLKEGIPFIRSQNVHFEGLKFDDIAYISEKVHKEMSGSKVYPNDVLLNITGASIGRCYFVPSELKEANVNQHVCIIRPNNKIITKYLFCYLSSEKGQAQILSSEKGISREGLTFEQIGNFIITLPLIEEQELTIQFIESEYVKNYYTISRIEKEIALLQEYRNALISEVVTGKVDVREAI